VTIATKGRMGKCGATITCYYGDWDCDSRSIHELLGLPGDPRDSPEKFFEDVILGGKYINNQKLVEITVKEAPETALELANWGVKWGFGGHAAPGHRHARGLYAVPTGISIVKALKAQCVERGVELVEDVMVLDLLTQGKRVVGATAVDMRTGKFYVFKAKAVVMATGGGQKLYPYTTSPEELTGDGMVMAYRAGAELVDMEMIQFVPGPVWPQWLIGIPALQMFGGHIGAWMLNKHGERFLAKWDPERMEETTRDIWGLAIMTEILEGRAGPHGGIFYSYKHIPDNLIDYFAKYYPVPEWKYQGFYYKDIVEKMKKGFAIELGVCSHFWMGGIKINERCETNLPGLFAAGETAGGVNGGNRLSGMALCEIGVWGRRAGKFAGEYALKAKPPEINSKQVESSRERAFQPLKRHEGISPIEVRKKIHKLAYEYVGPIRTEEGLKRVMTEIGRIRKEEIPMLYCTNKDLEFNKEWVEALQDDNLLTSLEVSVRSALTRKESRGAHYRKDYPNTDNENWLKNTVIKQVEGEPIIDTKPVIITKITPPKGISHYLELLRKTIARV